MHFVLSEFNQELLTILQNHINESTLGIFLETETPIKAFTLVLMCNYHSQCDPKCTNKHLLEKCPGVFVKKYLLDMIVEYYMPSFHNINKIA